MDYNETLRTGVKAQSFHKKIPYQPTISSKSRCLQHNKKLELIKPYFRYPARANTTSSHIPSDLPPHFSCHVETNAEATPRRLTAFLFPATNLSSPSAEHCFGATALRGSSRGNEEERILKNNLVPNAGGRGPHTASMLEEKSLKQRFHPSSKIKFFRSKSRWQQKIECDFSTAPLGCCQPPTQNRSITALILAVLQDTELTLTETFI